MNNILVLEDNKEIVEIIRIYLENSNFNVFVGNNGIEGLEILKKEEINLAIVDVMMPKMNGHDFIKHLREKSKIPVIILSAKNQVGEKILGLNIGADDYMTKPFDPLELVARVNSQIRRYYKMSGDVADQKVISVGDLSLDTEKMVLRIKDEEINLTSTEYKILFTMINSPGRVFTKAQLYSGINGEYFECDDNTMIVHISKLRDKMGSKEYIKTIRGLGYKLDGNLKNV